MGWVFKERARAARGVVAAAALLAAPVAAHAASASDLYYERSVMVAGDAQCRLFTADIGAALGSAQAQARGAALRAGVAPSDLDGIQGRAAAKVAQVGCGSRDLAIAAGRVRTAFAAYAQISRMNYPGDTADWHADRTPSNVQVTWRLRQDVSFGPGRMVFGLAGRGAIQPLLAVAAFSDGAQPYSARLVMRDPGVTMGPFIDQRAARSGGRIPLASRLPPHGGTRSFAAEARSPAGDDLKAAGMGAGWTFRFPAQAIEAMARLDPREAVAVEFVFSGRSGDVVRTAYVEVGDFAAGRAFLKVAQR